MLILGHVGIALGATQICEAACNRLPSRRIGAALRVVDYRFLALGAILPDLIDKPLAWLILPDLLEATRSIGHGLILSTVLLAAGYISNRRKRGNLILSLAMGCLSHLVLDGMWGEPQTLLWPAFGWEFAARERQGLDRYFPHLWGYPWLAASDIIGGLILGHLVVSLTMRRRLKEFFRRGCQPRVRSAPDKLGTEEPLIAE